MRAAPPIRVALRRFGVWRAAVATVAAGGAVVLGAWAALRPVPLDVPQSLALVAAAAGMAWVVRQLVRIDPVELAWDGRAWQVGPSSDRTVAGDLEVAVDLGDWLLLRFVETGAAVPARRRRVRWLPVQRRGLESSWHALRCAVHSPRPGPLADDAHADAARGPGR